MRQAQYCSGSLIRDLRHPYTFLLKLKTNKLIYSLGNSWPQPFLPFYVRRNSSKPVSAAYLPLGARRPEQGFGQQNLSLLGSISYDHRTQTQKCSREIKKQEKLRYQGRLFCLVVGLSLEATEGVLFFLSKTENSYSFFTLVSLEADRVSGSYCVQGQKPKLTTSSVNCFKPRKRSWLMKNVILRSGKGTVYFLLPVIFLPP